jgi:hypothetical protein
VKAKNESAVYSGKVFDGRRRRRRRVSWENY